MTTFDIRPYEPRDIGPVTSLVRSVRAAVGLGADFGGLGVDVRGGGRGPDAREGDGPPSASWIAEVEGELVGIATAVGIDATACALRRLYVAPDQHGLGIGGGLVETARYWAATQGFERLSAEVPEALSPAREFLIRRGFEAGRDGPSGEMTLELMH